MIKRTYGTEVHLVTIGSPRVGLGSFANAFNAAGIDSNSRYVVFDGDTHDVITKVPGSNFGYQHVGSEILLDVNDIGARDLWDDLTSAFSAAIDTLTGAVKAAWGAIAGTITDLRKSVSYHSSANYQKLLDRSISSPSCQLSPSPSNSPSGSDSSPTTGSSPTDNSYGAPNCYTYSLTPDSNPLTYANTLAGFGAGSCTFASTNIGNGIDLDAWVYKSYSLSGNTYFCALIEEPYLKVVPVRFTTTSLTISASKVGSRVCSKPSSITNKYDLNIETVEACWSGGSEYLYNVASIVSKPLSVVSSFDGLIFYSQFPIQSGRSSLLHII